MKRNIFSLIFCMYVFTATSQTANVEWAIRTGGAWWYQFTGLRAVATDAAGNTYSAGTFTDTADFDPGPGEHKLKSYGYGDGYITKTDPNGNFLWVKQFRNTNVMWVNAVKIDAEGNIYATGYFDATTDFDPGPDSTMIENPKAGLYDSYIVKLNNDGNLVWVSHFAGPSATVFSFNLAVDASGTCYASGLFGGVADFDPGNGVYELSASYPISSFITKINPDGSFGWANRLGEGDLLNGYFAKAWGIATDASGYVYSTGELELSGVYSSYVLKLNTNGTKEWEKIISPGAIGRDIAVDQSGNVITIGHFTDVTDFDPGSGVYAPTPPGSAGAYISKLDASGNFLWTQVVYGDFSNDGSGAKTQDVETDASGNIYAGFSFSEKIGINPGPSGNEEYAPGGYRNIVVYKLLADGSLNWTKNLGGCGYDELRDIAADNSGNLYLAGAGNNLDQVTLPTDGNFFVCKLSQSPDIPPSGITLSGRVWNDLNKNGIDNNEPPIVNFRVILYKDNNNDNIPDDCFYVAVQTDANGNYSFSNLTAGNYIVGVALPVTRDYTNSPVNGGDPDNNIDNDNNGSIYYEYPGIPNYEPEVRGNAITLIPGQEPGGNANATYDIGIIQGQLCLGSRVWNDINKNGRDNNEPGLANRGVLLYKVPAINDPITAGFAITGTTTDAEGNYSFCNLLPGHYIVYVEVPEGYKASNKNGGDPDNNIDKDNNGFYKQPGAVWGKAITLTNNQEPQGNTNNTYDFGMHSIQAGDDEEEEEDDITVRTRSGNETVENQFRSATVFPNPFTSSLNITMKSETASAATIQLVSSNGNVVYSRVHKLAAGINQLTIDKLSGIPGGMYSLIIRTNTSVLVQKTIKL